MKRNGLFNARFLLLVFLLVCGLFGALHYEPFRRKLGALVGKQKSLSDILHPSKLTGNVPQVSSALTLTRKFQRKNGDFKARRCPQDFQDMEGSFIFITIKTTEMYHDLRLKLLITTWVHDALKIRGINKQPLVKVSKENVIMLNKKSVKYCFYVFSLSLLALQYCNISKMTVSLFSRWP